MPRGNAVRLKKAARLAGAVPAAETVPAVEVAAPKPPGKGGLATPVKMVGGLLLVGAAGYYLLSLSGRSLSPSDATAVASLYLLANIIGPGLSIAMEQETSRVVSKALAHGHDPRPAIRRMVRLCGTVMAAATLVLLAVSPVLVPRVFHGHWGLFGALVLSVFTFGAMYLVRGVLGGHQRFTAYAITSAVEGLSRLVPLVALQLAGVANAVLFGLIFAGGCGLAALSGLPWLRPLSTGRARVVAPQRLGRSFGLLLGSALLMQTVANLAPVIAASRLNSAPAVATVLAAGFVVARVPLFLFAPVQAILLPRLVGAVARGDAAAMRRQVGLVLCAVAVFGAIGIAGSWLAGRWVLSTFFGARVDLAVWVLPLLAAGTILMMVMQVLQPALLALHRHGGLLAAWALGAAVLVIVVSVAAGPVTAAVAGQLAACATVVAGASWVFATSAFAGIMHPVEEAI